MKLLALSDLHVRHPVTRRALEELPPHPGDWLILGGDLGETEEHLVFTLRALAPKFARLLWIPGNHELWTLSSEGLRGVARYERMVELCRAYGALTPEDPYVEWPGPGPRRFLAPMFLLYDYSFRPESVRREDVLAWTLETGILCTDEQVLHPDPYPSRDAWCEARCESTAARLEALPADARTVLINHYPLLQEHAVLPAVPRFTPWCGTRRTANWHLRFRADVVVYGHLHIRRTQYKDGVRFEEVSLGYPGQWNVERGIAPYLREILPGPANTEG